MTEKKVVLHPAVKATTTRYEERNAPQSLRFCHPFESVTCSMLSPAA